MLRLIITTFLIVIGSLLCLAYPFDGNDDFNFYFDAGNSVIDTASGRNVSVLREITKLLELSNLTDSIKITEIKIEGFTSPEGSKEFNDHLALLRSKETKKLLSSLGKLEGVNIEEKGCGIDWDLMKQSVSSNPIPFQKDILNIIDAKPVVVTYYDELTIDYRILQLYHLKNGEAWNWLKENCFPQMRHTKINFQFTPYRTQFAEYPLHEQNNPPHFEAESCETLELRVEDVRPSTSEDPLTDTEFPQPDSVKIEESLVSPTERMALKTNLLYDGALMPSLELQYRFNNHWSVNLEGEVAWWKNSSRHKYYQLATISPEVRYHFKSSQPWKGHYLGLFIGFSWYDLENGKRGYKGEAGMAGLSYSYLWNVTKRLSLEAGLGLGVLQTRYRDYLPIDNHYVYQHTKRLTYVGPLKLKFCLVWRFWDIDKTGKK